MRVTILASALVFIGSAGPAWAQTPSAAGHPRVAAALDVVRVWVDAQRDFEQIPGLSVVIVAAKDVLWSGGYGVADLERRTPADADTLYSICSVSKLFTSIAVMQQRDAGRLRLDDAVRSHLPWLDIHLATPESGDITVQGLLTHASGLPRESAQPYWTGPDFTFPTREAIIAGLESQQTLYPATRTSSTRTSG
jgi:CubicO group peptidase (beta-lactamase class C family)